MNTTVSTIAVEEPMETAIVESMRRMRDYYLAALDTRITADEFAVVGQVAAGPINRTWLAELATTTADTKDIGRLLGALQAAGGAETTHHTGTFTRRMDDEC